MASFKDSKGRTWSVPVTTGTLARVKRETGVDLLAAFDPNSGALALLSRDIVALFDVLVCVLRPQLDAAGVTAEDFGDALLEDHAQQAVYALMEGCVDYMPAAKQDSLKALLGTAIKAAEAVRSKTTRQLQQVMGTTDLVALQTEIEQGIEKSLAGPAPAGEPAAA